MVCFLRGNEMGEGVNAAFAHTIELRAGVPRDERESRRIKRYGSVIHRYLMFLPPLLSESQELPIAEA
jgi:hypothetical protein